MDNQLLNYLQLGKALSESDQAAIQDAFECRTYKEGTTLFQSAHICRQLFFVCKGILRILVQNENGNEVTHHFIGEDRFCTILNSFTNQVVAHQTIQAACDAEVLYIDRAALMDLYEKYPPLKTAIDQSIQKTLLEKINTRNAYLGYDSSERYRLFLERQPDIARRVPLGNIASYLGITPQSLSRIRRKQ
ncbi:Crp/Fnr family transcriptional regulator [Chitinophaga sp. CF418]|uniref:Crp/Fnr family transcriptional regulator n=1 Tax=Chitinophaga sp. CF418 TaxID=1855287 RepID=UPI0009185CB1|nr:Crp/Fnr family transcriptional regulator [Chitinophaga sp. CF418]SHN37020.1 cAMP-binding domain of CRP or a regulatory subunit of cAMP-dependent protein kinases [Chitinophaga sp. CF418]